MVGYYNIKTYKESPMVGGTSEDDYPPMIITVIAIPAASDISDGS